MEEDVPPETKRCSKGDDCVNEGGPDQPLSNFNSNGRGGLRYECKSCQNARGRARYSRINNPRSTEPKICANKTCPKAGQLQPASCFSSDKSTSDGLKSNCKTCAAASTARFVTKSAHVFIRNLFNASKRRAKKQGAPFDMEVEDWLAIYDAQEGKCALSGIEMTFTYDRNHSTFNAGAKHKKWPYNLSPDQIDAGKGYVRGNVQFVCAQVNMMKGEVPTQVLLRIVCAMYHHNNIRPRRRRLMLRPRHARVIGS